MERRICNPFLILPDIVDDVPASVVPNILQEAGSNFFWLPVTQSCHTDGVTEVLAVLDLGGTMPVGRNRSLKNSMGFLRLSGDTSGTLEPQEMP